MCVFPRALLFLVVMRKRALESRLVETRSDSPADWRGSLSQQKGPFRGSALLSHLQLLRGRQGFLTFFFSFSPPTLKITLFQRFGGILSKFAIFVAFLEISEIIVAMLGRSIAMIVKCGSCYEPEFTHLKQVVLDNLAHFCTATMWNISLCFQSPKSIWADCRSLVARESRGRFVYRWWRVTRWVFLSWACDWTLPARALNCYLAVTR